MSGVCVAVGAVVGAVIGGGSSIKNIRKGNKKLTDAFRKQMYYMQMNYNYNQNALDKQERGAYDSAVSELFEITVNANQNNATVNAAINEQGFDGRTTQQMKRSVSGTTERQKRAIKDVYEEGVYNIRSQKDALYIQMKAGVEQARDNLNASYVKGKEAWVTTIDSAAKGAAIGAATAGAGSAAFSAAGASVGGASTTAVTAGTSAVGGSGATMGGTIAGTSLSGTAASGMGWSSMSYLSNFGSTFGSTFAKLYMGYGNTMGYGQMASLFSNVIGGGGTNQQYRYRRF